MARTPSIPENVHAELLAEAGSGKTTRQLAAWLGATHGVTVSHVTVSRFLAESRAERSEVSKAVLREKLAGSLTTDIDRLERLASQLDRDAAQLRAKKQHRSFRAHVEQIRKITETKLRYSGAAETDDATTALSAAAERVKSKLGRLSDPGEESTGGGDPGTDPG